MENIAFESSENDCRILDTKGGVEWNSRRRKDPLAQGEESQPPMEKVELKKVIGFYSCIGIVVGTVIGSGIFVSPKGVLLGTGSIGFTLIIWVICGFFSFMGALAFAELGTLMPCSAGQYMYLLEGFAPKRKEERLFWGPLVAFLYNWNFTLFARPSGFAVQGMTCAAYFTNIMYIDCVPENNDLQIRLTATIIISIITLINCWSTKGALSITNAFTATKLFALLFIIVAGFVGLAQGTNQALQTGFEGTSFTAEGISTAFFSGLWAYAGWDVLNSVVKEIKNPQKDILPSLMVSCTIITAVYMLTNVAYFILLSKSEFLDSDAVAVTFGKKVAGSFGGVLLMVCVICSVLGSTIIGNCASTRVCYAAAREGHMVDVLSYLHVRRMTPLPAFIFSWAISIFMVFNSSLLGLIRLSGFLDNIVTMITMVVLLMLRKSKKHDHRALKVPLIIPLLVFSFSLFLVVTPFVDNPKVEYFYVMGFLAAGVVVYVPFVYYGLSVPFLSSVKHFIQIVFEVAAPEDDEI